MIWFSNHLLVKPEADGTWDSRHLKAALKAGRLYGTFEFLGYADGFDFIATQGDEVFEMGEGGSVAKGASLIVRMPTLARGGAANIKLLSEKARLLRAVEGGWEEVAAGTSDLNFKVTKAGAYRAEIRVKPGHLAQHMAYMADETKRELVWVYSNVVYVTE